VSATRVQELFASDIHREIEEVIKVDQTDEQIIRDEISEYVATSTIRRYYTTILDRYWETPNKPHEGIGVWVSGFFGSGKSSFAKMLGLALENRRVRGEEAAALFGQRTGDPRIQVLLSQISERIPTEAVIFDVSTDRGIRSGNQTVTEIMYRLFLHCLGYAQDLDLSELEIALEEEGRLDAFKSTYAGLYNKEWDHEKGKVAFAIAQASRVMHELEPETYPASDSWLKAAGHRADITPGRLAERCKTLMDRRRPGRSLVFVVDEIGQFVARDVQKMLDLQAVVQNLGRVGRGRMWLVVTSQEKLNELVGGLDDRRVELARLMDRFPLQVHLEPSDISEVTSRRVLSKNADAEKLLRTLFTEHRGHLADHTRLTADIQLPSLTAERFVDLYPLLPYQVDLIIQVVSGLRTQGGASKHVGGANRTIIKLAQQLLIHPRVNLAAEPVGALARIDQMYDLVDNNIASEIRGKIQEIGDKVDHPFAQPVAKAICLLQYVKSIHRTAENLAACLHPSVDGDSCLSQVKEALAALVASYMVREGDDGYRIPTPAEDDWERQRSGLLAKPADARRIHTEVITHLWQPQPSHNLLNTKLFKAGLHINGRPIIDGDITVHLTLAEVGSDFDAQAEEMRVRSQSERQTLFWIAALDKGVAQATDEVYRSKEILSRRERGARTRDETALVAEEKQRLRRHEEELRRRLKQAMLTGTVYFRGNDRSPDEQTTEIGQAASRLLDRALPEVFDRFQEAAARVHKRDLEALVTTENLRGLTPVFTELHLVHERSGQPVFNTDSGPLAEVFGRIENRASYGENATGRYLTDEFAKEPFGWDFDVVRLFVIALLRAGKLEATSKGQVIDSALSLDARTTFTNNNLFRQTSFRPKVGIDFPVLVSAVDAFKSLFGREIPEIEQGVIATAIRDELGRHEEAMQEVATALATHALPGGEVLQAALGQMRAIRTGNDESAIRTFNSSYHELDEAIHRAEELQTLLTEPRLTDLQRARIALDTLWPLLQQETDLDPALQERAAQLADLMAKETFFRDLPAIDQHAQALTADYQRRYEEAITRRAEVYTESLTTLHATPGWEQLDPEQQHRIAAPLLSRTATEIDPPPPIPLLHADVAACDGHLKEAIEAMMHLLDGQRIVRVDPTSYFRGGIETEEQLEAALDGLREECERLIGQGRKVLIQ